MPLFVGRIETSTVSSGVVERSKVSRNVPSHVNGMIRVAHTYLAMKMTAGDFPMATGKWEGS